MTSKSKICVIVKETIAASAAAAAAQERSSVISSAGQGTSGGGSGAAGTAALLLCSLGRWQPHRPSLWGRGMGETSQWEMLFLLQRTPRANLSLATLENTAGCGAPLARI